MASQPRPDLPLFYGDLTPISSSVHGDWRMRQLDSAPFLANCHAVPLLAEEFVNAQRHYPIVFSVGENPVPLALMGLNEGVNTFVDEQGRFTDEVYVPAYLRRYPFMLARLRPDTDELSLCVDPTSGVVGPFPDGDPVFEQDGQPSARVREILGFCEQFEQASQMTSQFVREMIDLKLLIDGEFSIELEGAPQPLVYRGFQMLAEEKVRDLRGDVARKLLQSGAMTLIFAHLFSLGRMSEVFGRQQRLGKSPAPFGAPMADMPLA